MAIQNANQSNFKELISEGFVLVDFWGTTCGPCKSFSRILEDTAAELPMMDIVKVNVDDNPELAEENDAMAVPTVQFYKDGALVYEHIGVMQPNEIKQVISEYMYS